MNSEDEVVEASGPASSNPAGGPFEVSVASGLRVEPGTAIVVSDAGPMLDAASVRDLTYFLAAVEPASHAEITRPVGIIDGSDRRIVALRASWDRDGALHLELGRELRTERAPDRSELVDPRLLELTTMVWVTDADRLARWFNDAWLDFVGRTLEDQLGWGWMSCIHADDLNGLLEAYDAAQQEGRGFECAARVADAAGEWQWMLTRAAPRYDEDAFAGFVGTCEILAPTADGGEPSSKVTGLTGLLPPEFGRAEAADVVERLARLGESLDVVRPAEPVEASLLRKIAARWVEQRDELRDRHDEIVLTVGEAAANAALHAYDTTDGRVGLRCEMHDTYAEIRIRDWGSWRVPSEDRESRGLVIMARLADQLIVNKRSAGTEVVMRFNLAR